MNTLYSNELNRSLKITKSITYISNTDFFVDIKNNLSVSELTAKYNISYHNVYHFLKINDIKVNDGRKSEAAKIAIGNGNRKLDKKFYPEIIDMYVTERKPLSKIAIKYDVSEATIFYILKAAKVDIRLKNGLHEIKPREQPKLSEEILTNLYCDKRLSLNDIVLLYPDLYKSAFDVRYDMQTYKIKRRSYSEAGKNLYVLKPEIKEKAKATRRELNKLPRMTWIEKFFEVWCIDNNLTYEYQYIIPEQRHRYDFYLPEINLIVELDGVYWHSSKEAKKLDNFFVVLAKKAGYNIIRFTDTEIKQNGTNLFLERILNNECFINDKRGTSTST